MLFVRTYVCCLFVTNGSIKTSNLQKVIDVPTSVVKKSMRTPLGCHSPNFKEASVSVWPLTVGYSNLCSSLVPERLNEFPKHVQSLSIVVPRISTGLVNYMEQDIAWTCSVRNNTGYYFQGC